VCNFIDFFPKEVSNFIVPELEGGIMTHMPPVILTSVLSPLQLAETTLLSAVFWTYD
jgi:hypothetical protein